MQSLELALKASRKRQSPLTGFIHFCHEKTEYQWQVIPIYENFCFALTLLRTRLIDHVLEAKQLLTKLFSFQVNGHFPVYLHEYPECRHGRLNDKLYPVIFYILKDFEPVIGDKLLGLLKQFIHDNIYKGCDDPKTPDQWAEHLIYNQINHLSQQKAIFHWDFQALCYDQPQKQEKTEPAVTLYDLFLGEWAGSYSRRALQDHPSHLQGCLIYPYKGNLDFSVPSYSSCYQIWGDGNFTHSLVLETKGSIQEKADHCIIKLADQSVEDEIEITYLVNIHEKTSLWIRDCKATTFQLGDTITIRSNPQTMHLSFSLIEGQGSFWGHIYQGNRKSQIYKGENRFVAYDWVIGLRTVKREGPVKIQASLKTTRVLTEVYGSSP